MSSRTRAADDYGFWTALQRIPGSRRIKARWLCRCVCGTERAVSVSDLNSGKSLSCGCGGEGGRAYTPRPRSGPTRHSQGDLFFYCGTACARAVDGAVAIPLSDGSVTWVDAADFNLVAAHYWSPARSGRTTYAIKAHPTLKMHQLLFGCPAGTQVDHADRDGLNNRRSNLRLASASQNAANAIRGFSAAGYRGVHLDKSKFVAQIRVGGKIQKVGRFLSAAEAPRAYDAAALRCHGEFAILNFPGAS